MDTASDVFAGLKGGRPVRVACHEKVLRLFTDTYRLIIASTVLSS
jgi:hypothetical protein